ncbi:MAG: hypothetical protein WDW38_003964 [Sanguina aurantia]
MPTATLATQTTIPSPPSTPSSSSNPQIVYLSGACGGTASCPSSDTPLDEEVPFQCPSLLSLSVSTLGRHVTKFVRCCGKLDFLPTDVRGCLIAAARKRKELTDALLVPLLDRDITLLDLSGTGISPAVLLAAVAALPRLLSLDLTGLVLSASDWLGIGHSCPLLQLLRLGGLCGRRCRHRRRAGEGVAHGAATGGCCGCRHSVRISLEPLPLTGAVTFLVSHGMCIKDGTAVVTQTGRLRSLRVIIWLTVTEQAQDALRTQCPLVLLNPLYTAQIPGIPAHFLDPGRALDEGYLSMATPRAWQLSRRKTLQALAERDAAGGASAGSVDGQSLSIAEKFRLAYIDKAKHEKERERQIEEQWRRRVVREGGQDVAAAAAVAGRRLKTCDPLVS